MPLAEPSRYTSKIIKAGALLPDTKMMLANWDEGADVPTNLSQMQSSNLFGKASRSRIEDILAIFRQRYLGDPSLLRALVTLIKCDIPVAVLDPILYFQALQSDALLHDTVTDLLASLMIRGRQEIERSDVDAWLVEQIGEGKTEQPWGEETKGRVARGILATLRDFGILQGNKTKRIAPLYLPTPAFSFIAFLLSRRQPSGERLLRDPEWQVFFLHERAVERFFIEAHAEHLLQYYAACSVIRVEFPAATIEEYAHVVAQRAH